MQTAWRTEAGSGQLCLPVADPRRLGQVRRYLTGPPLHLDLRSPPESTLAARPAGPRQHRALWIRHRHLSVACSALRHEFSGGCPTPANLCHRQGPGTPGTEHYRKADITRFLKIRGTSIPPGGHSFLTRASPATDRCPSLRGGRTRVGDTSNNDARGARIKQRLTQMAVLSRAHGLEPMHRVSVMTSHALLLSDSRNHRSEGMAAWNSGPGSR